jgi:kynurenine 3-monooxygenase
MVPFYGQGMNAGLEDVFTLYQFLDRESEKKFHAGESVTSARKRALEAYTKQRTEDAAAICDLAMKNYMEMSQGVVSPLYRVRKHVEEFISYYIPSSGWRTQYARVSFGGERYSDVIRAVAWQGRCLSIGVGVLGLGIVGTLALGLTRWRSERDGNLLVTKWLGYLVEKGRS